MTVWPSKIRRNIVEVNERKCGFGVDLDESEILLFIASDVVRVVGLAVVRRDFNFQIGGAFHDVLVGHDVTRGINQETRPETLQRLPHLARTRTIIAEKLRGKIFKRIAHLSSNDALGVDVNHRGQDLRDREDRGFGRRIGLCEQRGRTAAHRNTTLPRFDDLFNLICRCK